MKFRSDFVTNSSSSCYIVSYEVQGITFQPLPDDYMGELSISYARVPLKNVMERIKNGASIEEIVSIFANSTNNGDCLYHMFTEDLADRILRSNLPYEEILEKISEGEFEGADESDVERAEDYLERIRSFRKAMSRFSSASDIKEMAEIGTYTGWGEFLSDSIEDFVNSLDSKTKRLAKKLLGDYWWSDMEEATEATWCNVTDGTIITTKEGYIDTKDYILDMYWDRFEGCGITNLKGEMPKLEFIAEIIEPESSLPKIVDALLSKDAADYAEQFLNRMTELGGKHAEVAESLRAKVEEAKMKGQSE